MSGWQSLKSLWLSMRKMTRRTEASKVFIQPLGKSWPPENRTPNLSVEASKASRRKGQCLQVCLPVVAGSTIEKKPGTELLVCSGPSAAEGRCWERSQLPLRAPETPTQHLRCLCLGFRRLEMQAEEIIQILVRICLKTGLSSKQWWAKAFYLRRFLPCKESYRTCPW